MIKAVIKIAYGLGIAAVILALAALSAVWFLPKEHWDYKVVTYTISSGEEWEAAMEQQLDELGDQNWDLIEVHTVPSSVEGETTIVTYWRHKFFE